MFYLNYILFLLLQLQIKASSVTDAAVPEAVVTDPGAGAGAATVPQAAPQQPGFMEQIFLFLPLMLAMVVVFLMMNRTQSKSGGDRGTSLDLKKNDRVVTVGGIVGTVVKNVEDSEFTTLRIDDSDSTKMQFLTSAIARKLDEEDAAKS